MLTPTQSVLLILDTDLTARGETLISRGILQAEDGGRGWRKRMEKEDGGRGGEEERCR